MIPDAPNSKLVMKSSQQNSYACERELPSFALNEIQSPQPDANNVTPVRKCNFPAVEIHMPLELQDSSFSEDCLLNSRGKSESVEQKCKFKRLRKLGDLNRHSDCKRKKNGQTSNLAIASHFAIQRGRGKICSTLTLIYTNCFCQARKFIRVFWNSFDYFSIKKSELTDLILFLVLHS